MSGCIQNRVEQSSVEQNRVEQSSVEQNRVEQSSVEQNRVEQAVAVGSILLVSLINAMTQNKLRHRNPAAIHTTRTTGSPMTER